MRKLTDNAVKACRDQEKFENENALDVTVVDMLIEPPGHLEEHRRLEPQDNIADEPSLKWQLYFHGQESRGAALRALMQGVALNLQTNTISPELHCNLSELADGSTKWCCFRLEFLIAKSLSFKKNMLDEVLK